MRRLKLNDILSKIATNADLKRSEHYDEILRYFSCRKKDLWLNVTSWKERKHAKEGIRNAINRVVEGDKLKSHSYLNTYQMAKCKKILSSKKLLLNMRKKHKERKTVRQQGDYAENGVFAIRGSYPEIKLDGRKTYCFSPTTNIFHQYYDIKPEYTYPYSNAKRSVIRNSAKTEWIVNYTSFARVIGAHTLFIRNLGNTKVFDFPKNIFIRVDGTRVLIFDKRFPDTTQRVWVENNVKGLLSLLKEAIKKEKNLSKQLVDSKKINFVNDEDVIVSHGTLRLFLKEINYDSSAEEEKCDFVKLVVNKFGNYINFVELKNWMSSSNFYKYHWLHDPFLTYVSRIEKLRLFRERKMSLTKGLKLEHI